MATEAAQPPRMSQTEGDKLREKYETRIPVIVRWSSKTLKLSVPKSMKLGGKSGGLRHVIKEKWPHVEDCAMEIGGARLAHYGVDAGKTIEKLDEEHIAKFADRILYIDCVAVVPEPLEAEPARVAESPEQSKSLEPMAKQDSETSSPMGGTTSAMVMHLPDQDGGPDATCDAFDMDWDMYNEQQSSNKGKSAEAKRVLEKYPERVPVHCQEADAVPPRVKKLLPRDTMTVRDFKRILIQQFQGTEDVSSEKNVSVYIGNMQLDQSGQTMKELYMLYKSNTGFLHCTVRFGPDTQKEELREELRQSERRVEEMQKAMENAMITLQDMKDFCGDKDDAVDQAEKAKQALVAETKKVREAEARCVELELQRQTLAHEMSEKLASSHEECLSLKAKLAEMVSAIERLEGRMQEHREESTDLKAQAKRLKDNLQAKSQECESLKDAAAVADGLRKELSKAKAAEEVANKEVKANASKVVSLREQLAASQAEVKAKAKELETTLRILRERDAKDSDPDTDEYVMVPENKL